MALLLIFDEPIDDPAETIKKALSRALVPYHPMAGRLVAGADDDAYLSIACTGEGVPFVAASASCALEEAMTALSPGLLRELTVRYPGELCRLSDALVLMQVGAEHGYYGNCLSSQLVLATNGTVASSEIKDLVKLIKGHADILDLLKNGGAASGVDLGRLMSSPRYHTIAVSSWRNLGMEATDFGGGKPARAMWQPENSAGFLCVVCPPCKGKDGVNVLSRCVTPEHAEAFLRELAALDM
ncbi:unnamed protein product [Triticum turgidum subsp. durum]|uniref:Uncharacterized protein n=1 Tax=Triticum turgidum subsp. durum TaxID=4567 RepID=A0A9R1PDH4_TRITD|nr:unnamed protein product [Triticum turgidum subsp. durum]